MSKRRNPDDDEQAAEAIDKFREFHRFDPKRVGPMPHLVIPHRLREVGRAKWVTYRSNKTDPETLRRPRKPVDYIHEHDAGVTLYLPDGDPDTEVPQEFQEVPALTKLGLCLGFGFIEDGEECEARGQSPLPELYCTPNGRALLVVQNKRTVLAMMWGGALGVFARGIDG